MRAIVRAATHWPSARRDGLAVPSVDEDGFTLAATAAERLFEDGTSDGGRVDSIWLVGDSPPEAVWGIPEAIGHPDLDLHHHPRGPAGLAASLVAAAHESAPGGATLVVGVDLPSPDAAGTSAEGAGAVAFLLRDGAGLLPVGEFGRRHPVHRAPDASAWVEAGRRAARVSGPEEAGQLIVVAKEAPPVLLNVWSRNQPGMTVVPSPASRPGAGAAPTLALAEGIRRLTEPTLSGDRGLVASIAGETTRFLGFQRTGPVEWRGDLAPSAQGTEAPAPPLPAAALEAVSEGAYVPRPRYIESLGARWRFVGERCAACGTVTFPPRGRCRGCAATEGLTPFALPRTGSVEAATIVAPGAQPSEFDPIVEGSGRYGVAILQLVPGVRVTVAVTGSGDTPLPAGTSVRTELRRLYPMEGEWRYGRKAIPPAGG